MAFELFVNGTLMRGLALHANLEGAEFLGAFRTAPRYRLHSIDDHHPGMFEVPEAEVEATIALIKGVMEGACLPVLELSVPLVVDAGVADNWAEAH